MIPTLAGVHHLKLPVSDLDTSIAWYGRSLGYQVIIEFREHGRRTGVTMAHPDGGPWLGLVHAPERARAAAGFDYFSIGVPMAHPDGGPWLGLVHAPERARAAAGFDYFSIGVPDRNSLENLAAHLSELGEQHAGVHFATVGWILPMLHDPDGHEVRFYSMEAHADVDPATPLIVDDARSTAEAKEQEWLARQGVASATQGQS